MKKTVKLLLLLLCAAMLAGCLLACGAGKPAEETGDANTETGATEPPETGSISASALSDYRIIYPSEMDYAKLKTAMNDLIKAVDARFGVCLDIRDDFVREGTIYSIAEHEILLGTTNREESQTVCAGLAKANDYEIRLFGEKLVIAGITEEAVSSGIRALIETWSAAGATAEVFFDRSQNVRFTDRYELSDLTVDGTSISEFTVVYENNSAGKKLAEQVAAAVRSRCGYPLPIQSDLKALPAGKCIFIGKTTAPAPSDLTLQNPEEQYYAAIRGGNLYLYGRTVPMVYQAIEEMLASIQNATEENRALALSGGAVTATDSSLVAMSFNILCDKRTDARDAAVIDTIRRNNPDTFGVQEATPSWMTLLKNTFGDEYGVVGEGRNGGNSGEYSAVFYRKSRFNLIASGTQWLSDTPTVKGSKMAGAAYPRVFTYAVLECKDTGRRFIHVNTHTDHVPDATVDGNAVRLKQVQVITEFLKRNYPDLPTIISGDLNDQKTAPSIRHLLNAGYDHCADIALSSDPTPTFKSTVIDYLLYSHNDFFLYEYKVDTAVYTDGLNGRTASDHNAIIVRYEIP